MFYTYLRGLVMLILWSINGNAHYHNTDKIPSRDEKLYPRRTSPYLVGSCLHGLCDQAKTVHHYGQKRNCLTTVSLAGGSVCVAPFLSTEKNLMPLPSSTLSTSSKKATALSSCSQREPSLKRCQGWSCLDCQNGQGTYHAGHLHRSHDLKRFG